MRPVDLRLYAIADPAAMGARDPVEAALAAVRGGATLVQLRDKRGDARATVALARRLKAALPATVPLVINDRVDVAAVAGADGVHLGQEDLSPAGARALLGDDAIVGLSVHHPHEAASDARIDYVGLGPAFATASKHPRDVPLGPEGLARLLGAVRERLGALPACAIAGIDAARAPAVIGAGVDGVAVIAALFHSRDVEAAARRLRAAVDAALFARSRP
ncbi:MAG: thiamine phosphate synthase [Alphaproteobacteria bacterium]